MNAEQTPIPLNLTQFTKVTCTWCSWVSTGRSPRAAADGLLDHLRKGHPPSLQLAATGTEG
jgi:hypothetical protein